jgi:hypothetical protein
VSAAATFCVQDARNPHPEKSNNPNYGPQWYRGQDGHKNCKLW